MNIRDQFNSYLTTIEDHQCYMAGLPGYPQNFSRDTLLAGIIATDTHLLSNQLTFSHLKQGKTYDQLTGEEPGKIHHQYPAAVVHSPYRTTYNACETTALYLIALELLYELNESIGSTFITKHQEAIRKAVEYLQRHIVDYIFWEFPPKGARHFSLHTTYWKDSIVPRLTGSDEPRYPVAYALVQFQTARAFLSAAKLLDESQFKNLANKIYETAIHKFITADAFCVEEDNSGRLEQASSDELHALAYIPATYKTILPLPSIAKRAKSLTTKAGIACTPADIGLLLPDQYHGYVVWMFEQALIHYGCKKFGLNNLAQVANRCQPYIHNGQELISVVPSIEPLGNKHQLWSVAADIYFSDEPSLRINPIL